jgi:hypothetical protein
MAAQKDRLYSPHVHAVSAVTRFGSAVPCWRRVCSPARKKKQAKSVSFFNKSFPITVLFPNKRHTI